jgi:acyl carrier protein
MNEIEILAKKSLQNVCNENNLDLPNIKENLDLIESLDSMIIVDLLLETEKNLEKKFGKYMPLADENTFDSIKSPLKEWSKWVSFIKNIYK